MNSSRTASLVILVAIVVLTGCSANDSAPAVGSFSPLAARLTKHAHVNGDLLYVLDSKGHGGSELTAFTYPAGKRVKRVHIEGEGTGLCADSAGNVYVVEGFRLQEFAHGARVPIRTIENPYSDGGGFHSCAVDASTGDVTVVFAGPTSGNIFVYPPGSTSGYARYPAPEFRRLGFCAYDASGNLYLVALNYTQTHAELWALPSGASHFQKVQIGKTIPLDGFGGVQWQGGRLVLAGSSSVFRSTVRTGAPWRLKLHGSTQLEGGTGGVSEFWIGSGHIAVPYLGSDTVIIYDYPSGKQTKTLTGFTYPIATAISPSQ